MTKFDEFTTLCFLNSEQWNMRNILRSLYRTFLLYKLEKTFFRNYFDAVVFNIRKLTNTYFIMKDLHKKEHRKYEIAKNKYKIAYFLALYLGFNKQMR